MRQILDDPDGNHDWGFDAEVDLEASDEGTAVIRLVVDAGRKDENESPRSSGWSPGSHGSRDR